MTKSMAVVTLLMTSVCAGALGGPVPYGHSDFYPSSARTLGWRGDGSGAWPGARVVRDWDANSGRNIVWKMRMPAPSHAVPLVVGEKVFTLADPDQLICVNAHNGEILWQTWLDHAMNLPEEEQKRCHTERQWILDLRHQYGIWQRRYNVLARLIKEKEGDPRAIKRKLRKTYTVGVPVDEKLAEAHAELLKDPEIRAEYEALQREGEENGFQLRQGYYGMLRDGHAHLKRAEKAWYDFDLPLCDNWGEPWCTLTFASPCTDGEAVYVVTCNNATARVDLDGKIQWLVWERMPGGTEKTREVERRLKAYPTRIGTRFVASPLLHDGKLVVNQNGLLRVYEAATGEKLWEIYNAGAKAPAKFGSQFPWRPTPEACSPTLTVLTTPKGEKLAVLGTGGARLFRLDDGKELYNGLPVTPKGHTPLLIGDLYVWKKSADNRPLGRRVYRLTAPSRDAVEVTVLWDKDNIKKEGGGAPGATDSVYAGRIYSGSAVVDAITGEVLRSSHKGLPIGEGPSQIIAGDRVVSIYQGYDAKAKRHRAGTQSLIGGRVIGADFGNTKQDREFTDRNPFWNGQHDGSPSAQANRIFWRSRGHLFCVGDPVEAFPVPATCPPAARVRKGGAADEQPIREAKTLDELSPVLRHVRARCRFLAIERCRELGITHQQLADAGLTNHVNELALTYPQPGVRAAAVHLLGVGEDAPGRLLIQQSLAGARRQHWHWATTEVRRAARTFEKLGADAVPMIVAFMGEQQPPNLRDRTADAVKLMDHGSDALCEALVALAKEQPGSRAAVVQAVTERGGWRHHPAVHALMKEFAADPKMSRSRKLINPYLKKYTP